MAFDSPFTPLPPILQNKRPDEPSVFRAANMIREARRQKALPAEKIPAICVLDPDGDLARLVIGEGQAKKISAWACYHTEMFAFEAGGRRFGIIGNAVGAAFAVLLAEQAFASGCEMLVSITSAGQINPVIAGTQFVLIDRALRDEGTSYHYLPAARFAEADPALVERAMACAAAAGIKLQCGASWTTDAPFRETATAIAAAKAEGILTVEMEAAALYAFAAASGRKLCCFAQVTNQMGQTPGDFEKGEANGARAALALVLALGAMHDLPE